MQVRARAVGRPWTLVGHLDATSSELEPSTTREAVTFQNTSHPDLSVVLQLRRKAWAPEKQSLLASLERGAALAGMAGAVGVALAAPGWPLALGLATLGLSWLGLGDARRRQAWAEAVPHYHSEPAWTGTRTLDVGTGPSRLEPQDSAGALDGYPPKTRLHSPVLDSSPVAEAPDSHHLAATWKDALRRYPSEHTALLLSGHGDGWRGVAGLKPADLGRALADLHLQQGQKVDLVMLECCRGANLETLHALGQHARYAMASEDDMAAAGFPWAYVLPRWSELGRDAADVGKSLVRLVGGIPGKVETLALIDLEKLVPLTQAVESLASALDRALEGPDRSAIITAFQVTRRCHSTRAGLNDLGELLDRLRAGCRDAQILERIDRAHESLGQAVVQSQGTSARRAPGLSIQGLQAPFSSRRYLEATGMGAWAGLLKHLGSGLPRVLPFVANGASFSTTVDTTSDKVVVFRCVPSDAS